MTSGNKLSRFATFMLWVQRRPWLLPKVIRRSCRSFLQQYLPAFDNQSPVEDWSAPLVIRGSTLIGAPIEMPTASDAMPAAPNPDYERLSADRRRTHELISRFRCLIVTRVLDAGGVDEFVAFLARQLPVWGGFDTTVMCASSQECRAHIGRLATALATEGISVVDVSLDEGREWLAVNRPDVISAHDPPDWILREARSFHIPVVETLHGVPTPIGTNWSKEPIRSRYITSLVAVSDLVRRQYLRGNPNFANEEIVTIPNAFNVIHRPAINRAKARAWLGLDDELLFISLARHVVQKNAYALVTAFADVAREIPQAHLLIAGRLDDRPYAEQVRLLRDGLPVRNRIHLRENLSNPSPLLAAADGFVLNSFFEGWSLASMEALCAGLPVVMSEVGGAHEQVGANNERGYIVPNPLGDPETVTWESAGRERFRPQMNKTALVEAIMSVIKGREYWAAVRATLAEESKRQFSVRICVERHARILRRAILHSTISSHS
jgi:glycosyltransferase involved in cell wall biosynthesis